MSGCDIVRQEASKYSGWDAAIVAAIAKAESGCKTEAKGDTTLTYEHNGRIYGYSLSVLQVRILPGRERCDTHDITINVKCAYEIWQGQGYAAWTMYNNSQYLAFL